MEAVLIKYSKDVDIDGSIQEIVIWQLPEKSPNRPHDIKYRLYFGLSDGTCLIRYDNEIRKGDHKHLREREEPYVFLSVPQLLKDFWVDIEKIKKGMI